MYNIPIKRFRTQEKDFVPSKVWNLRKWVRQDNWLGICSIVGDGWWYDSVFSTPMPVTGTYR